MDQTVAAAFERLRAGDAAAAERLFRDVLEANPAHPEALNGMGLVALQTGHEVEAIGLLSRALEAGGERFEVLANLASAYSADDRPKEALPLLRRALAAKPDAFGLHNNLAVALQKLGRLEEAEAAVRRAIALNADHAGSHYNLGQILEAKGWFEAAAAQYRRLLEIEPRHAAARAQLAHALVQLGRADEGLALLEEMLSAGREDPVARSTYLLSLHYSTRRSAAEISQAHSNLAVRLETSLKRLSPAPPPRAGGRLRVGYLSPDFRRHSVAFFFEPLLAHHDRERFEVFCYHGNTFSDEMTGQLKSLAEHWVECGRLDDAALAARIVQDRIDVLVDLAGPTAGGRMGVFAMKPAPVQAAWLGYPAATGLATIDARISDARADPQDAPRAGAERIVRLPESYFCYAPPREAPPVAKPPILKKGFPTFGSFNALAKVSDECIALWAGVLARVPRSRLLLKAKALNEPAAHESTAARFAAHGVGAERLVLRRWTAKAADHLAAYREVDIALDTFPYNGATTTCDALWMGVPVVSLAGERHAARMGLSILSAAGRAEWCVREPARFAEIAASLAEDPSSLGEIRSAMRERLRASALLDAPRFAHDFESLLGAL